MRNINDITWIYDREKGTCHIQEKGQNERELTLKGITNKGREWYQVDELKHHWISFNPDKFNNHTIEVFYKQVEIKELADGNTTDFIAYYRQIFKGLEKGDSVLIFSFSEFDEWIKENGKWKSKYGDQINKTEKPWRDFNNE